MTFANSISICLIPLFLLVTGCASTANIPNVKVYKEIPFLDAPEGVYMETLTRKKATIPPEEWAKLRPYLLMIDIEGWIAIRTQWYEACRQAGPLGKNCNVMVHSIDTMIRRFDELARSVMGEIP